MFCWRMIRANLVEALAEIDDLCERLRYLEMGTLPHAQVAHALPPRLYEVLVMEATGGTP